MKLRLRIPDWAKGANSLLLNGSAVSVTADAQGYAVLDRVWQNGDTLTLELPMQAQSIDKVEGCQDTADYTAFRRGPIVYCAEAIDNAAAPAQYYLCLFYTSEAAARRFLSCDPPRPYSFTSF